MLTVICESASSELSYISCKENYIIFLMYFWHGKLSSKKPDEIFFIKNNEATELQTTIKIRLMIDGKPYYIVTQYLKY